MKNRKGKPYDVTNIVNEIQLAAVIRSNEYLKVLEKYIHDSVLRRCLLMDGSIVKPWPTETLIRPDADGHALTALIMKDLLLKNSTVSMCIDYDAHRRQRKDVIKILKKLVAWYEQCAPMLKDFHE